LHIIPVTLLLKRKERREGEREASFNSFLETTKAVYKALLDPGNYPAT
jgi:hypothetical protein